MFTFFFGKLGPNLPKFEVFGQLFKFESSNFSDFAYFNRKTGYLTDLGGSSPQKKYLRLLWAIKACLQIDFLSPN